MIGDALPLRGSRDLQTIEAYRALLAMVVSRRNARNRERIDAERQVLRSLPERRSDGFEETLVRVTRTGGFFSLHRVFYTVPSRLVGHRLRERLYDDRLVLFAGTKELMTLPRGHAGPRGRVIDFRHVLPSLRRKRMALLHWTWRDGLFPATPTAAPSRRCSEAWTTRKAPAVGWWTCWPWPTTTAARRGWRPDWTHGSTRDNCPIPPCCASASCQSRTPCRTLTRPCRRCRSTTASHRTPTPRRLRPPEDSHERPLHR